MIRCAAFDIGRKNFAHSIEDVPLFGPKGIFALEERYKKLSLAGRQRTKEGRKSEDLKTIIEAVLLCGETIHHDVINLCEDDPDAKRLSISARLALFSYLNSLRWLWTSCDLFIIEQQYFSTFTRGRAKRCEANIDAIKLAENVFAWFTLCYPKKKVEFYGARFKTRVLGAPGGLSKHYRKKWAVNKMFEIMKARGEEPPRAFFPAHSGRAKKRKLDDIADCVCMTQAYKFDRMVQI